MNVAFKFRFRHLTKFIRYKCKLFQILTPFLEKDIICLSILKYLRKKLPLVDDLVIYE